MASGNSKKVKVTICPNYLDRSKQISDYIDWYEGLSVDEFILSKFPKNFPVIPSVNGQVIKGQNYDLAPGDHLVFVIPLGSGLDPWEAAKNLFTSGFENFTNPKGSVFDSILDSIRSGFASIPIVNQMQDFGEQFARDNPWVVQIAAGIAGLWTYGVGSAIIYYAANRYGITGKGEAPSVPAIPKPKPIGSGGGGGGGGGMGSDSSPGFSYSNSYSWNPVTQQQVGIVIPRIYGVFKTKGNVLSGYISTVESGSHPGDQILNVLIGLCQGPISTYDNIKINNRPYEEYDNLLLSYRLGDINQTAIEGFQDTYREYSTAFSSTKLEKDVEFVHRTEGNDFNALRVTVTFPNGLYYVKPLNSQAHYENVTVETKDNEGNVVATTVMQKYLGSTSYGGDTVAYTVTFSVYYKKASDSTYTKAKDVTITESKTSSFIKQVDVVSDNSGRRSKASADIVKGEQYDLKLVRTNDDSVETGVSDNMYWTGVTEIIADDFTYPKMALCCFEALATSQLSGNLDFECDVRGSIVAVYDGASWSYQWSDNPAWVAYDILTQPVFSGEVTYNVAHWGDTRDVGSIVRYDGIHPDYIDTDSFKAWADFCDYYVPDGKGSYEKRFVFNGVFDTLNSVWDAALEVCKMSRASIYIKGYKYYVTYDDVATPVQMFTSGNIIADSFQETFLSITDRATEIEVDFANEDNLYRRETISIIDPNATRPKQLTSTQLIGCTKTTQAWRVGRYVLYNNQYVVRFIKFDADIDAIACNIGDVIYFAHELPQWGFSGRVVSADSTTVTLDRNVSMTEGVSYAIRIRLNDDTIVYKTTSGTGSTDTLTVSAFSTVPSEHDIYTFGMAGLEYKPFRITKIQPNSDLTFTIEGREYNATIFNCDTDEPAYPTPNYSSLDPLPPVTDIVLDEIITKTINGLIVDNIDVYWKVPENFSYVYAEVWYKSASMSWYELAGRSYTDRLRIANLPLTMGQEVYTVYVSTVNSVGKKLPFGACPSATITMVGKADPPSNVAEFYAAQWDQQIRMDWRHIEDADLWGYEIRMGNAWDTGLVIGTQITSDYFYYSPEIDGTYQFFICAIDTTNHYSTTPKSVSVTVSNITPTLNIIYNEDEVANGATGTKFNFTLGSGNGLCDEALSLEFTTSGGTGYYITDIIDMSKTGSKTIRLIDDVDATEDATDLTFPDRTDLTYPDDTDLHVSTDYYKYPSFMYSDGTGFNGVEWTPYFGPTSVDGQYFKFREDFVVPSQTALLSVCEFRTIIDVPEAKYKLSGITIDEAGTTITFADYGLTFYATPVVNASIVNATISLVPSITDRSATSVKITLLDIAGQGRDGYADIHIFGY